MKKVSTLVGIIIIVLSAVVLFGGVFIYQYFYAKPATSVTTQKQEILNKPFPLAGEPTNQTAGWETYKNSQYGFEIKYPGNWKYQNVSCNLDFVVFCPVGTKGKGMGGIVPGADCGVTCGLDTTTSTPIFIYLGSKMSVSSLQYYDSQYKPIYDQMLPTFKFTNSSVACFANFQCVWGPCVNGSQMQSWTDTNNCGVPLENVGACPRITRICTN
jgi:hypothetical protein